jgi:hypothetical protein
MSLSKVNAGIQTIGNFFKSVLVPLKGNFLALKNEGSLSLK